jgi:hypothetical protein
MAGFKYNPNQLQTPSLPKLGGSVQAPAPTLNNEYARKMFDSLTKDFRTPVSYTQKYNLGDTLAPTQQLGQQFIQQNLLPEYQQLEFNPLRRRLAMTTAGSNNRMLASNRINNQRQIDESTRSFYDRAGAVQDQFNALSYDDLNNLLKSYYDTNLGL